MDYQAKLSTPFGMLGIRCDEAVLRGIDFLFDAEQSQAPVNALATQVCLQLHDYIDNPDAAFSVPLDTGGTHHQQKVWQAMLAIPRGQTRTYGEIAFELHSCAQAVGQACGANPIPIIIPCHRIVSKSGLGGFAKHARGAPLDIKRWLLAHESNPLALAGRGLGRG
jgi:methylated-DNA-[protein]-cysteine S-methyltransferase